MDKRRQPGGKSRAQTWEPDFWVPACPSPTACTNRVASAQSPQLPACECSRLK